MATVTKNLGIATAYGYAKSKGYTGTEEEFAQLMADLTSAVDDAEASASDAEAYGAGTRSGTAVPSTDDAYHNNAKYYKEQAEQSAQSIAQSASQIATNTQDIADLKDGLDDVEAELPNKANIDGYYQNLTSGNAEQLISTQMTEDKIPYLYRTSGGMIDIGDREYDEIVGGTVVWNQLMQNGNFSDGTSHWLAPEVETSISAANEELTVTIVSPDSSLYKNSPATSAYMMPNHIYVFSYDLYTPKAGQAVKYNIGNAFCAVKNVSVGWNVLQSVMKATFATEGNKNLRFGIVYALTDGFEANDTYKIKNVNVIDLTTLFGSAVADHIYSLEQANAGDGVAYFRKFFPNEYYAYSAPTMKHVEGLQSHDMVGFNQWDEEWEQGSISTSTGANVASTTKIRSKNYVRVFGSTEYCISLQSGIADTDYLYFYDGDKHLISTTGYINGSQHFPYNKVFTTPTNCRYIRFIARGTSYTQRICINLSWSGWRNGEFESYVKHSYPLDSSVVLRGMPKVDANGNLYYDGDTYASDGTVTRRYGIVDLGTLNWQYFNNVFYTTLSTIKCGATRIGIVSDRYVLGDAVGGLGSTDGWADKSIRGNSASSHAIYVKDSSNTSASEFKTAMDGVYVLYELATPTTEEATPYQTPQICDDFGTEEYVTTSIVPVGHVTNYPANLRDKIQHLPSLADNDGYYMIQQTDKQMSLIKFRIPQATGLPDGTYTLKATVSNGTPTYTWVAESEGE